MPHVAVKLVPGKSDEQKRRLADAITADIVSILGYSEDAVSVSFEEVQPQDWTALVYRPEIQGKWENLFKKPGYEPS